MVRRIVERFHPERVILFGSHARGTAGPQSDVDLLVVMQAQGSKRRCAVEIHVSSTSSIGL
ncbi:MAG: nucleotidyltransferase domain-containing protein [Nitrospira sp.]|nr:nucleotidyltransferase domain-containing protein [Nitrospira sp.]